MPSYEYESVAARAAAIEQGAGRSAAALVADVGGSADGFIAAADGMPTVPALGVNGAGTQLTAGLGGFKSA